MFENQVVVVTGGARGIGFGIARKFVKLGAKVVLFDIETSSLRKAVKALGASSYEKVDVTNEVEVNDAVGNVLRRFGSIHVVVQCAGITGKTGIRTEEVDFKNFQTVDIYDLFSLTYLPAHTPLLQLLKQVLAVNLSGIFLMCKAVLPQMRKQRYGRIINIASIAGKEGNAGMLAYSSSKAAVIGLTKVIGKEYAEEGITCNAIAPAVVRTPMVDAMPATQVKYMTDKIPMKRTGEIDEIASLAAFVASKDASFTTAFTFDATGGRATY